MALTASRDFRVGPLIEDRQTDLDVVCHRDDAGDPLCGLLGFGLLAIATDKTGEGNDAVLYRHRDIGCIGKRSFAGTPTSC